MRLAVVADIHGNLPALDAVLADLGRRRIDRVINLGDCVSGPLWPQETARRLMELGWPTVRGNHDRWTALDPPDRLGPSDAFARAQMDDEALAWLAALPLRLDVGALIGASRMGMEAFHGRPGDDNAYLLEDVEDGRLVPAPADRVADRLGAAPGAVQLCGHSHLAGVLRLPDGRLVVNPGSVGCPAYEDPSPPAHVSESGTPEARYAVLDLDPDGRDAGAVGVELVRLSYDFRPAVARAAAGGRPVWAQALATGRALA